VLACAAKKGPLVMHFMPFYIIVSFNPDYPKDAKTAVTHNHLSGGRSPVLMALVPNWPDVRPASIKLRTGFSLLC
jgi:hypothetical protein